MTYELNDEMRRSIQEKTRLIWKKARDVPHDKNMMNDTRIRHAWMAEAISACTNYLRDEGPGTEDSLATFDWILEMLLQGKLEELINGS